MELVVEGISGGLGGSGGSAANRAAMMVVPCCTLSENAPNFLCYSCDPKISFTILYPSSIRAPKLVTSNMASNPPSRPSLSIFGSPLTYAGDHGGSLRESLRQQPPCRRAQRRAGRGGGEAAAL